jgi:hypothetical protein
MPVLPGEIIEHLECLCDQRFSLSPIPAVVRLYRLDHGPVLIREWADLPGCLVKGFLRGSDEFKLLRVGRRVFSAVADSNLVDKRIQGRSELVQHLAELERKLLARESTIDIDVDGACPIGRYCDDRYIGIALIDEVIPDFPELSLMKFGALEPSAWSSQFHAADL